MKGGWDNGRKEIVREEGGRWGKWEHTDSKGRQWKYKRKEGRRGKKNNERNFKGNT